MIDQSGNNLTGTIVGATWTTSGRYGNALSFNGVSSYVDLGNPVALHLTGSMTLEAWIKAVANPSDDGQIIAKSNGAGWQLKTSPDTGPHTFGVKVSASSSVGVQRYSTTVPALGTWYHIAGVYDAAAGTLSTYVNGALDNGTLRGTVPAAQIDQSVNVNIGRRTGGLYFNGLIDEVRIYNRALSQAEIQVDMATPVGSTPPPPDTTPPTVSITTPASGATVAGTTAIAASAADNVGVAGVQFLLDGANLGSEVLTPPFTLQWNTATASIGAHTLDAVARDFSGNRTTSSDVSVTVSNPSPAQVGPMVGSQHLADGRGPRHASAERRCSGMDRLHHQWRRTDLAKVHEYFHSEDGKSRQSVLFRPRLYGGRPVAGCRRHCRLAGRPRTAERNHL